MNVMTNTFVGLKCLTETKIQILYDHVDHTRFHIVEMGCQIVQLLSAYIVELTMFVNLTPALEKVSVVRSCSPRRGFLIRILYETTPFLKKCPREGDIR